MNALEIKRKNKRMIIAEIDEDKYLLRMVKLIESEEENTPSVFHNVFKGKVKHSDVLISYEAIMSLYALTHKIIFEKEINKYVKTD